jgi:hypothetical protein
MEKDKYYGIPLLWKRVLVGTWVKGGIREEGYKDLYKWMDQRK